MQVGAIVVDEVADTVTQVGIHLYWLLLGLRHYIVTHIGLTHLFSELESSRDNL